MIPQPTPLSNPVQFAKSIPIQVAKRADEPQPTSRERDPEEVEQRQQPSQVNKRVISKRRIALIATGGAMLSFCIICSGCALIFSSKHEQAVLQDVAEANKLWESGNKAAAVDKYRTHFEEIDSSYSILEKQRAVILKRVIEFNLDQGNTDSAKKVAELAVKRGVDFDDPRAKQLVMAIKAERTKAEELRKLQAAKAEQAAKIAARKHGKVMTASELANFIDGTDMYAGKTLTMDLIYLGKPDRPAGLTHNDLMVPFKAFGIKPDVTFDIWLTFPTGTLAPQLSAGTEYTITFTCELGNVLRGNNTLLITRVVD